MTVARFFIIGKMFSYSDAELWRMTPRKLSALLHEYKAFHGQIKEKTTIDDVIPL